MPVAALSKALVCGHWHVGFAGFESHRMHGSLYLVSVMCFQVEVSVTGRSLFQRSPT
jgi:hypothetical protein